MAVHQSLERKMKNVVTRTKIKNVY